MGEYALPIFFFGSMIASAVGTGVSAYSQYEQAQAQRRMAEDQAAEFERQSKIADQQAEIAQMQGEKEIDKRSRALAAEIGALRASYAGNGFLVDAGEGSTIGKIEKSAAIEGYDDIGTLRANERMNVWGFKEQSNSLKFNAAQSRASGAAAARGGMLSAVGTALGGAGQIGMSSATYYKSNGGSWFVEKKGS